MALQKLLIHSFRLLPGEINISSTILIVLGLNYSTIYFNLLTTFSTLRYLTFGTLHIS